MVKRRRVVKVNAEMAQFKNFFQPRDLQPPDVKGPRLSPGPL
jgi:hypothetical protein